MKRIILILVTILTALFCASAFADTLVIPSGVTEIEEEAFFGDTSLDEVILPEGIKKIGARAFVGSSVTKMNLPGSLEEIADDAFEHSVFLSAETDTYASSWIKLNGFNIADVSVSIEESGTAKPVPGTTIIVSVKNTEELIASGKSDDNGKFSVSLPLGTYTIRVFSDWYDENYVEVHVADFSTQSVPIYLSQNDHYVSDVVYFDSRAYQLFNEYATWTEAKEKCETLGGHLATITSREEQLFIENLIKSQGSKSAYWIGATDSEVEGTWKWITNEVWDYTNWDKVHGQPDNAAGSEDYLQIYSISEYSTATPYKWNDQANDNRNFTGYSRMGYICEWGLEGPIDATPYLKAIGRDSLVQNINNIMLSESDLVSVYYIEHKSEFGDIIDLIEQIINGKYSDLVLAPSKKIEYLFAQALEFMDEDISFELGKIKLKQTDIAKLLDIDQTRRIDVYFEKLADYGINASDFSPLQGDDFKKIFDDFVKGDIKENEVYSQLNELLGDEKFAAKKDDLCKSLIEYKDLSMFVSFYKDLTEATKIIDKAVEGLNQLNFLCSIDDTRMLEVASIYQTSSDATVKAVGEKLEKLAKASTAERILMIATDQFADYGLDKIVKEATKGLSSNNVTFKLANLTVNFFTSVDQLAGLKDKIEWNVEAVHTAYTAFIDAKEKFDANGTDENLAEAYRTLKTYYGAAAQAEASLKKLYKTIDDAKLGDLFITDEHRTMMDQLDGIVTSFKRFSAFLTMNYDFWQTGDAAERAETLSAIYEKYPVN